MAAGNMVVQNNIAALNVHRNMKNVGGMQMKASERLSSGYKINRASDDAAGLAISEKMRGQIRGLNMASKNVDDAISLVKTAEGGMQGVDDMLHRIRELLDFVSNDTNENNALGTGDRQKVQDEIDQLVEEIDSMAGRVEYNKKTLIDGSYTDTKLQLANANELANALGVEETQAGAKDAAMAAAKDVAQGNLDIALKAYEDQVGSNDALLPGATAAMASARAGLISAQGNYNNAKSAYDQDVQALTTANVNLGNLGVAYATAKSTLGELFTELNGKYGTTFNATDMATVTSANLQLMADKETTAGDDTFTDAEVSADATRLFNALKAVDVASVAYGIDDIALTGKTAIATALTAYNTDATVDIATGLWSLTTTNANTAADEAGARALASGAGVGGFAAVETAEKAIDDGAGAGSKFDLEATVAPLEAAKIAMTDATNQMTLASEGVYGGAVASYETSQTDYEMAKLTYDSAKKTALDAMAASGLVSSQINSWTAAQITQGGTQKTAELVAALKNYDTAAAALGLDELKINNISGTALADAMGIAGGADYVTKSTTANTKATVADAVSAGVGEIGNWEDAKEAKATADAVYNTVLANRDSAQGNFDTVSKERDLASVELTNVTTRLAAATLSLDAARELDDAKNSNPLHFQVGANGGQSLFMSIGSVKSNTLGIGDGKGNTNINVIKATGADITANIDVLDQALSYVTTERSRLGAAVNRMEYTQQSLDITSENLSDAESRIRDADMAQEMMNKTKADTLQQVAVAMMSQANQQPQSILQLLR